jgi:hypothetical protein
MICFARTATSADCDEFEVERGKLVLHKGTVESTRSLVTGICCDDRKAARESRLISCSLRARRFSDAPVQAASTLLEELSGPVFRKRDGETDSIGFAI